MKMNTIFILLLCASGALADPAFVNVGSFDTVSWSPSTNETNMAYAVVEHHCRYFMSDQRRNGSEEIHALATNDTISFTVPVKRVDEHFTIAGLPYSAYRREIRAFLQGSGD